MIRYSTPIMDSAKLGDEAQRSTPKFVGEAPDHQVQRGRIKSILLVLTVTFATVLNDANATAFSIALPIIQKEMQVQEAQLQWIVSAYPLSSGCLLLVCGRLADLYGRKKIFLFGSVILAVATGGCVLSKNVTSLSILRGIQGVGSAAQIPASLGILAHAFPPSRSRSIAFATFSSGAAIGAVFGTISGGVLTEYTKQTWRSSCYLLTAMTVVCVIGGILSIDPDQPTDENDRRVDWIGTFLVTAGLFQIIFVLSKGELPLKQWATPSVLLILVLGILCLLAFLCWQYYLENLQSQYPSNRSLFTPPPLLKLSIWTRANGRLAAMMAIAFFNWGSFLAWLFWVELYYQNFKSYTPLHTAVLLLPMFFSGILCNLCVGFMAARIAISWIISIGTVATTIACLLFAVIHPNDTYWAFAFPAISLGAMGADIASSAGTLFIARFALPKEQSVAGALFMTMTQVGTSVGVTVSTVVFNTVALKVASSQQIDQIVMYRAAQWTAFGFGVIASILSVISFRGVGVIGESPAPSLSPEEDRHMADIRRRCSVVIQDEFCLSSGESSIGKEKKVLCR